MSGLELVAVLVAVTAGAAVKAVTGMGLPVVAVPVLAAVVGVSDAVVIMALPGLAANAYLLARHRRSLPDAPPLGVVVAFGVPGAALGAVLLSQLSETLLEQVLAATILIYVVWRVRWPDAVLSASAGRRVAPLAGAGAGLFQGAIGVSGPIVVAYVHSQRPARAAHVAAVTAVFGALGLSQFVAFGALGELSAGRLVASFVALVPVAAATLVGSAIGSRIDRVAFDRAVLVTLAVAAVVLVVGP